MLRLVYFRAAFSAVMCVPILVNSVGTLRYVLGRLESRHCARTAGAYFLVVVPMAAVAALGWYVDDAPTITSAQRRMKSFSNIVALLAVLSSCSLVAAGSP